MTLSRPAQRAALCGGIVLLVALIYAPVRHHAYLDYDDMALIVWNPDMEPASLRAALEIAFARRTEQPERVSALQRQLRALERSRGVSGSPPD